MTPSRAQTRERLLDAAMELFYSQGFHATSLADILGKSGVNSGSLYYYFKSKDELLRAVLDRYMEMLWPAVVEPVFAQVSDPIERIFGILQGYRQGLEMTGCTAGCPIGNLAIEVSDTHPDARDRIAQNFGNWRGWVRRCLDDAADRLPPGADRDALATFVLTVMEGGVMQARAHRSLDPFDASVEMLRDYFNRLLAEGQARQHKHASADRAARPH